MRPARLITVPLSFIFWLFSLSIAPVWGADTHSMRAGAAKVDITPSNLTNLNSFGGSFKDVHDPIFARALVMDNGVNTVAIVALDLVEIGDTMPLRQRVQSELGIPADHIIITASHDHNAPRAGAVTPGGIAHPNTKETDAFTLTVNDKIVAALKQAKAALQPAKFGLATGKADININRDQYTVADGWFMGYNPDGPSDKTVWVMKFETPSGEPIAILFNYGVHSTSVLGTGRLSGDIGGAAARYVESRYNNKIVALYTIGPAGDQNPKVSASDLSTGSKRGAGGSGGPGAQGGPNGPGGPGSGAPPPASAEVSVPSPQNNLDEAFQIMDALGLMVGAEVVRVSNGMENLSSSARIEAGEKVFSCPVKAGVNQMGDLKQAAVASSNLHLSLILINDIAITGVSGEVVTNIYWHLRAASPLVNTMMITLANDRIGYIADDAAYDTPKFEVNGTPLARGCAEPGIVNGLVELINKNRGIQ